jgi:hypothetical protein
MVACPIAAGLGACADASGHVVGGGLRYDAQPPDLPDTGNPCGTEVTWTSLYKDFFGPGSKGSCSGATGDENNCHLKAEAAGALASNGYVCGMTQADCFMTFKSMLVPPMMGKDHYFEVVLRQSGPPTGVTPMPLRPASAVFSACDLDRIRRWADKGAPND